MNRLKEIVTKTLARENMLSNGDTIVVGVSGGADSVVLLHFLCGLRDEMSLKIKVCHMNHKIRKSGTAERDAEFVKNLCANLGVEFFLREIDIPSIAETRKESEELVGREERYRFFEEIAGQSGKIATAHNKNDNVETVLMRLVRGTGLNGLSGIPYKRENIIRPLLDVDRDTIEQYIKDNSLKHITDETNLEAEYTRNKVRLLLIPFIKENFNGNFINSLGDMIPSYSEDYEHIEKCAESVFSEVVSRENEIDLDGFNKLDSAVKKRVISKCIRRAFRDETAIISNKVISEVLNLANGCYTAIPKIGRGYCATYKSGKIRFWTSEQLTQKKSEIVRITAKEGLIELPNFNRIYMEIVNEKNVTCNEFIQYVPISMCDNLVFRKKVDGDRFLAQPGMHQRIKKTDEYMLCKGSEVLWIPGKKAMRLENRSGLFLKLKTVID